MWRNAQTLRRSPILEIWARSAAWSNWVLSHHNKWWNEGSLFQLGFYQPLILLCCMTPDSLNRKLGACCKNNSCRAATEVNSSSVAGLYLLVSLSLRGKIIFWNEDVEAKDRVKRGNNVTWTLDCHLIKRLTAKTDIPFIRRVEREALLQRQDALHLVLVRDAWINTISCTGKWISQVIGDEFTSGCCVSSGSYVFTPWKLNQISHKEVSFRPKQDRFLFFNLSYTYVMASPRSKIPTWTLTLTGN